MTRLSQAAALGRGNMHAQAAPRLCCICRRTPTLCPPRLHPVDCTALSTHVGRCALMIPGPQFMPYLAAHSLCKLLPRFNGGGQRQRRRRQRQRRAQQGLAQGGSEPFSFPIASSSASIGCDPAASPQSADSTPTSAALPFRPIAGVHRSQAHRTIALQQWRRSEKSCWRRASRSWPTQATRR